MFCIHWHFIDKHALFTGMFTSSELAYHVELIPLEERIHVYDALDLSDPKAVSPSMLSTYLEAGLKNWRALSPTNRREKLAKILLQKGYYKAVLKSDAKCTYYAQNQCNEGVDDCNTS